VAEQVATDWRPAACWDLNRLHPELGKVPITITFADETRLRAEDRGTYLREGRWDANHCPPEALRTDEDGELRQLVASARNAIVNPDPGSVMARRVGAV